MNGFLTVGLVMTGLLAALILLGFSGRPMTPTPWRQGPS